MWLYTENEGWYAARGRTLLYAGTLDAEMSFLWAAGFLRTLVVGQLAVEGAVEQLDPPCKLQQRGA
jgi:hypothetical protein